jgi:hypothetical protein
MLDKSKSRDSISTYNDTLLQLTQFNNHNESGHIIPLKVRTSQFDGYGSTTTGSFKLFFWNNVVNYPETFWYTVMRLSNERRKKVYVTKCSDRTSVTAG